MGSEVGGLTLSSCEPGEITCHACLEALALVPDSRPLLFHCAEGHYYTLSQLLDGIHARGLVQLVAELRTWRKRAIEFYRLAGWALSNGHAFAAADLQDAGRRIDERIVTLGSALAATDDRTRSVRG